MVVAFSSRRAGGASGDGGQASGVAEAASGAIVAHFFIGVPSGSGIGASGTREAGLARGGFGFVAELSGGA